MRMLILAVGRLLMGIQNFFLCPTQDEKTSISLLGSKLSIFRILLLCSYSTLIVGMKRDKLSRTDH